MNNNNSSDNNSGHFYAFLPLITDPGDEARNRWASLQLLTYTYATYKHSFLVKEIKTTCSRVPYR